MVNNNASKCDQIMMESKLNQDVKYDTTNNNSFYNQNQNFDEIGFDNNQIEMNLISQEQDSRLSICNQLEMFESVNDNNRKISYENYNGDVIMDDSVNIDLDQNVNQNFQINYPNISKNSQIKESHNDGLSLNTYSKSISNYNRATLQNTQPVKTINRYQEEEPSEDENCDYGYSFNNTLEQESFMNEQKEKSQSANNDKKIPLKIVKSSNFIKNPIINSNQNDQPEYFEESFQDENPRISASHYQLLSTKKNSNHVDYIDDDQINLFESQSQKDFMNHNNNESVEVLKLSEDYDMQYMNNDNSVEVQQEVYHIKSPSNFSMGFHNKKTVKTRYECEDD